ncbi:geranylgeranyl pyrophosphate synthetase [Colletotrichum kahawae]|uniref:Geranylgeranyl pyrophosphate synthetase n=1 Tax=Colletotrichum kahawae TaxID=34407 RepID=A0AAE0CX11_COLKA|nr:geranylgeranyl pyrophosphate synthetase [Colletotrichum kahawae]
MGYGRFFSFGHSFEEEFTEHAADIKGSLSHHRAIRYQFGDLNLVVRHEVEPAQPAPTASPMLSEDSTAVDAKVVEECNVSSINGAREYELLGNRRSHMGTGKKKRQRTTVLQCGAGNPPSDLVEMKARPRMRLSEVIDQMWFGRTSHLVNGIHEGGEFLAIKRINCEPLFQQWEQQRQNDLSKLERLISLLRREVSIGKGNSLVAVCRQDNDSVLEFWTSGFPETPLPHDLIDTFWSAEKRDALVKAVSDPMGPIHQDLEVEVGKSTVLDESTKIDDTAKVCQLQPKRRRRLPWQRA